MSEVCTKDNVCKFFNYEVYDLSDTSDVADTDKCGSDQYLGGTCKAACCQQQNEHCFKSQTAAFKTMKFYNQCMGERNCEDEATCDPFFQTGGSGSSVLGIHFNYDVDPNREESLCGESENGGDKCKENCCSHQWEYCTKEASINDVHVLLKCMADRNCTDYATKMTTGKDDDGNPICKGLDDFNYSVDPNESDDYKCGGEWQAGQRCKAQCCEVNIEYCKQNCAGDTDPDKCITDCTKQRNCHSELTCDDYTHDVKPSDDQKCGGEEKGGSNCHKQCCETQAEWCGCGHNSRDCMKDRGCDNSLAAHDVEFTVSNSGASRKEKHWFPNKCKKIGESCSSTADCGGHGLLTNPGTACCGDNVCKDKRADNVLAYYCPETAMCWHECCNDTDCPTDENGEVVSYCDWESAIPLGGSAMPFRGRPSAALE